MLQEKIGPHAPENVQPGMLASTPDHIAEQPQNLKLKAALRAVEGGGIRWKESGSSLVLSDREYGHLIGNPCVVITRQRAIAFVLFRSLARRAGQLAIEAQPWGWGDLDKEFPQSQSPAVDRYALKLLGLIRKRGVEAHHKRERDRLLRLQERARI